MSSSEEILEEAVGLLQADTTATTTTTTTTLTEVERNPIQEAINLAFESTSNLANLLPTGTVLAFQILSPIFTNQGDCDGTGRILAGALAAVCGLSCVLLSFTDSIKDEKGNVCYGFATFSGFWIMDGKADLSAETAAAYKLKFMDFAHAAMSVLVFAAVAMFDQNMVRCFFPEPSAGVKHILTALPIGIGVGCSMLFVAFPTTRHGIGFPISAT